MATRLSMVDFFLNGCIGEVVQQRHHLLCLFHFRGCLVGTKWGVAGSHLVEITHLGKGGGPVGLPVVPRELVGGGDVSTPASRGSCYRWQWHVCTPW